MIEVGPRTSTKLTYDEAVMYCFCLGGGWRLPTSDDWTTQNVIGDYSSLKPQDSIFFTPVRDLKDD